MMACLTTTTTITETQNKYVSGTSKSTPNLPHTIATHAHIIFE